MTTFSWNDLIGGAFPAPFGGTALTVGTFDGPHRGHKALFAAVTDYAKAHPGMQSGAVTFAKPPASLYAPQQFPGTIVTLEERLTFFQQIGLDFAIVIDFSLEFARIEGEEFLRILKEKAGLRFLAESTEFRMGYRGIFDVPTIEKAAPYLGFTFAVAPPVMHEGARISSSRIRDALIAGDVPLAETLLGHPVTRRELVQERANSRGVTGAMPL
jgi:FAD synthase